MSRVPLCQAKIGGFPDSENILLNIIQKMFKVKRIRERMFKTFSQTAYDYADCYLSHSDSKQKVTFKAGLRLPYIRTDTHIAYFADEFNVEKWKAYLDRYFLV